MGPYRRLPLGTFFVPPMTIIEQNHRYLIDCSIGVECSGMRYLQGSPHANAGGSMQTVRPRQTVGTVGMLSKISKHVYVGS
jgi:hypothetical protein